MTDKQFDKLYERVGWILFWVFMIWLTVAGTK